MTSTILSILGSILGLVATYFIGKFVSRWLQLYYDAMQKRTLEDARKKAQADNQKANQESDDLKKIDGR